MKKNALLITYLQVAPLVLVLLLFVDRAAGAGRRR